MVCLPQCLGHGGDLGKTRGSIPLTRKEKQGEMSKQIPLQKSPIKVCIVKANQLWTNKSDCNTRGDLCV